MICSGVNFTEASHMGGLSVIDPLSLYANSSLLFSVNAFHDMQFSITCHYDIEA
jgi:hypothetical protein